MGTTLLLAWLMWVIYEKQVVWLEWPYLHLRCGQCNMRSFLCVLKLWAVSNWVLMWSRSHSPQGTGLRYDNKRVIQSYILHSHNFMDRYSMCRGELRLWIPGIWKCYWQPKKLNKWDATPYKPVVPIMRGGERQPGVYCLHMHSSIWDFIFSEPEDRSRDLGIWDPGTQIHIH